MITGGMFSADSPTAIRGADKILPVDVYIPGCPPRPEAIIDAIIKLRKKISTESLQQRGTRAPTHRYYSIGHKMKTVSPIFTGEYLRAPERREPSPAIREAIGMPVPPALMTQKNRDTDVINPARERELDTSHLEGSADVGA